jgi:Domain of unknown function (DUF5916)
MFPRWSLLLPVLVCAGTLLSGRPLTAAERPSLTIPRLDRAPSFEDFLDMQPDGETERRMAKVDGFVQTRPRHGEPVSERTEAYLGYDAEHLYIVFVCHDSRPDLVRAHMVRREGVFEVGDDDLEVRIDTFNDQRRSYYFVVNPLGIQLDASWPEVGGEYDESFDEVWHSRGNLTAQGYVAWMALPFRSFRFPAAEEQVWGINLVRYIARNEEAAFWPPVDTAVQSRLAQMGRLEGLRDLDAGRGLQAIPYGTFRSFETRSASDDADPDGGVDLKAVLRGSLALDATLNPDFSQVESDQPQIATNQRFELFFPEKRPFFLENAGFFQTPLNLVFTRRIADPRLGLRLTGKQGPYTLAAMAIDDESPGKLAPPGDPLDGERAGFGILRVTRDLFEQSSLGIIYTGRELDDSSNQVGGIDGRFRLNAAWTAAFQGVASSTRLLDGDTLSGSAWQARADRSTRELDVSLVYDDRSPGFRTLTGFDPRPDIRRVTTGTAYRFFPEATVVSWGPRLDTTHLWNHTGELLDWLYQPALNVQFARATSFSLGYTHGRETLDPREFPELARLTPFDIDSVNLTWNSSAWSWISFDGELNSGRGINFVPPPGAPPAPADLLDGRLRVTLKPLTSLIISNTLLYSRLSERGDGADLVKEVILRSQWAWQIRRELSLRLIAQWDESRVDPVRTQLLPRKGFNGDVLVTYLVNPWTAFYLGYNSNYRNLDPEIDPESSPGTFRRRLIGGGSLERDARQFFFKVSYLIRP